MSNRVFIGRKDELDAFKKTVQEYSETKTGRLVNLYGEPGIGKSSLLRELIEVSRSYSIQATDVVNLAETSYQDPTLIADYFITKLGAGHFSDYHKKLVEYSSAPLELKSLVREELLSSLLSAIRDLAKTMPLIITFDTLDSVKDKSIYVWLLSEFIPKTITNVLIAVAGRDPVKLDSEVDVPILSIPLQRFTNTEVNTFARKRFEDQGEDFYLELKDTDAIFEKTQGRPILVSLAVDWLLETGHLDSILSIPKASFDREIARRFSDNKRRPLESNVIVLMAILDRGFSQRIYRDIEPLASGQHQQILESLKRFSFIKYLDVSGTYFLHDEMLALLKKHGDIPPENAKDAKRKVVQQFYQPAILAEDNPRVRQGLVLDCLYYTQSYALLEAFSLFTEEFKRGFEIHELEYCNRLIEVVHMTSSWSPLQAHRIDLLEGELLLKRNNPLAAARIFSRISSSESMIEDEEMRARLFENLGKCSILGCEIAGDDVSESLEHLRKAMAIAERSSDVSRIASIRFHLGLAQEMLGDHKAANDEYLTAIKEAEDSKVYALAANITDRLVLLLRRTGDVTAALEWALKSMKWREGLNDPNVLASSYHNLGTVYRDLKKQEESVANLNKAINLYQDNQDYLNAAQALKDLGWTYFVFGDKEDARIYAEKSLQICNKYGFGRIKGEALHTIFEIVDADDGESKSQPILDEALTLSRKHAGLFMLLDLLMHQILIDKRTKHYEQIPERLKEIEDYMTKGCRYHYFLGRALVAWGDCAIEQANIQQAFDRYHRGYEELAKGGESAAFQSSYKKQLKDHLPKVIKDLPRTQQKKEVARFKAYWENSGLDKIHHDLIDVLDTSMEMRPKHNKG